MYGPEPGWVGGNSVSCGRVASVILATWLHSRNLFSCLESFLSAEDLIQLASVRLGMPVSERTNQWRKHLHLVHRLRAPTARIAVLHVKALPGWQPGWT